MILKKNCLFCGKEFIKPKRRSLMEWFGGGYRPKGMRFCSKSCGAKYRVARNRRLSIRMGFKIGHTAWNKGMFGENNSNWKGGITSEYDKARTSLEYNLWRESVYLRDNYTCQKCNDDTGGNLNAHHIKNFSSCEELRTSIKNGTTFCKDCHIIFHKKYGYSNNTKEQLEDFLIDDSII